MRRLACVGAPSLCFNTCGNGLINLGEQCDDGNSVSSDGCSGTCKNEPGWYCALPGTACQKFDLFIDSPAHGIFTTAGSVVITGHYTTLPVGVAEVRINGVLASGFNPIARTFSHKFRQQLGPEFRPSVA